ncbi:MAG TPA: ABC transporter substrate-binding protein [Candidatus Limnocylindrales bacterium]|nr:ABC transporter substrate-binding protein [Candidatus Limnocylindrales bacterium]
MRRSAFTRISRIGLVPLLAVALVLPAGVARAQDDLVLRVGTTQDLDSMSPFITYLVVGFEVFALNYELLVEWDENLQPMPAFAQAWEQSDDGLTWTFTISPDKRWSDGEPATAEDAAFTFNRMLELVDENGYVGYGYLDPYLTNAGVTSVEATDPQTLVITTDRPNTQVLYMYIPILPRHIWEDRNFDEDPNEAPVVGTGKYQAVNWVTGQRVEFERNPHYDGPTLAADRLVIQIFRDSASMAEALRNNELDYAHNVSAEHFDRLASDEGIVTVNGQGNGYTELAFNTYGTGTGNVIEGGGGASTPALQDAAFRDALGYAIDRELLVERLLNGYGEPGASHVPPFQTQYHVQPDNLRTFDLDEARSRLEAAGYELDDQGRRLDQDGNPINLRLYFPDSSEDYAAAGQFIADWFGELGIGVSAQQMDSGALGELLLPPEAGDEYNADFDMFIWGWGGDIDPNSLLEIFTCDQIGQSSDSLYCNPEYDQMFQEQNRAESTEERAEILARMQNLIYDEAPYHILYYDDVLAAYRTDRFTGWQNQPEDGVPLFNYGSFGYGALTPAGEEPAATPATGEPTPAPGEQTPAAGETPGGPAATPDTTDPAAATPGQPGGSPAATPGAGPGGPTNPAGGDNMPMILGLLALAALGVVGFLALRRRRGPEVEEE